MMLAYETDTVREAKIGDLPYVVDLSKKENHALGFIPKVAYESAITGIKRGKRWSLVCNDMLFVCENNEDLVGFCLASFGNPIGKDRIGKIAQICIQEDARKIYRGRLLLESVLAHGIKVGCRNFKCGCADDLESNLFWKAMSWNELYQRKGISHQNTWLQTSDRLINVYGYYDPRQLRFWP
jgi:hypothetical protein